jgi:SAM-dependent methyltransferase
VYAAQHALAQRRLLDVGAGLGVFPAAMKAQGWEVVGLEPDPRNVAHLRQVVGIVALAQRLEALDPATTGRFTAITFNKVLEHVEDPVSLLAAALPLLADGGFIYIEVPDVAAAVAGPGREEFFIEHHHVFSPASLEMMVERAGMTPMRAERLREPSGKYTLAMFATVRQ